MIYMTPQSSDISSKPAHWGLILSAKRWNFALDYGRPWCMDTGTFSQPFDQDAYFATLNKLLPHMKTCKFVVVPDTVANAVATLWQFRQWAWRIKALGFPVAFVAQDGQEAMALPPEYDALFIGGTTEWKMSTHADKLIRQAQSAGKWVHVGRVNSQRRIRHFQLVGVDSVDGTSIAYAPDKHYRRFDHQLFQRPLEGLCLTS
jgi:hypothetical protein